MVQLIVLHLQQGQMPIRRGKKANNFTFSYFMFDWIIDKLSQYLAHISGAIAVVGVGGAPIIFPSTVFIYQQPFWAGF